MSRPCSAHPCTWEKSAAQLSVRLCGDIDLMAADKLDEACRAVGDDFGRAVVDFSAVTFFGAPGLAFLSRLAATGAPIRLQNLPPLLPVPRMLEAVNMHTLVSY